MRLRAPIPFVFAFIVVGGLSLLAMPVFAQEKIPEGEVGTLLQEMMDRTERALEASRSAEQAETVRDVKVAADTVFRSVWGVSSGLTGTDGPGASRQHGWKTRWQTTPAAFDSAFAARMGTEGPEVDNPRQLGIMGRGRSVRRHFATAPDSAGPETPGARFSHDAIVAPLSNIIGWMRMDNGITKGELQPRVDLTYRWDAPMSFWNSSADSGWLLEVYSQALNILKTKYDGNVEMAREHAAGMTQLLEKVLNGVDANDNGTVEAKAREGGLRVVLEEARAADLFR